MRSERLARAGVISLLGGGTGALCGLLLAVAVGRGLGAEGAGFFFQTVALFVILANVFELGADTGLVRALSQQVSRGRTADLRRTVRIAVLPVVAAGAAVGVVLWLVAGPLAAAIADAPARSTTASLITIVAPFVLAASLLAVLLGGTRGLGSVVPFTAVLNIGLPVARLAAVSAALLLGLGLTAVTWMWAAPLLGAVAVAAVILRLQLRRAASRHGEGDATPAPVLAREFWVFSGPRGVAAGVEIALGWAPVLLVAALAGQADAGVFAVVTRCVLAGLLVETAVRLAVSRHISARLATGDVDAVATLQLGATRAMILLSWPYYLTLAFFAPVVLTLFGPGFGGGTTAMAVLGAGMLVLTATGTAQTVLLMGGRSTWQLANKAVALTIAVVANLLLVPEFGVTGAAAAVALAVVTDAALTVWQVHRSMRVRLALAPLLLPMGVSLATVGTPALAVTALLGPTVQGLLAHLALSAVLFGGACWSLRGRLGLGRSPLSGRQAVASSR